MLRAIEKIIKLGIVGFTLLNFNLVNGYAASGLKDNIQVLKVVHDPWKPYHKKDVEGKSLGYVIDILTEFLTRANNSEKIQYKIEYQEFPWARGLEYLKKNKIDILISGRYDKERAKLVSYVRVPIGCMNWQLIRLKENKVRGFQARYAEVIDYSYPSSLKNSKIIKNAIRSSQVPNNENLLLMLFAGHIDVAILEERNLESILSKEVFKKRLKTQYDVLDISADKQNYPYILDKDFIPMRHIDFLQQQESPLYMMLSKKDSLSHLHRIFEAILTDMQLDGTLTQIHSKNGVSCSGNYDAEEIAPYLY